MHPCPVTSAYVVQAASSNLNAALNPTSLAREATRDDVRGAAACSATSTSTSMRFDYFSCLRNSDTSARAGGSISENDPASLDSRAIVSIPVSCPLSSVLNCRGWQVLLCGVLGAPRVRARFAIPSSSYACPVAQAESAPAAGTLACTRRIRTLAVERAHYSTRAPCPCTNRGRSSPEGRARSRHESSSLKLLYIGACPTESPTLPMGDLDSGHLLYESSAGSRTL